MTTTGGDLQPISHAAAVARGWRVPGNEMGSVTRAWEEWFHVDQDQRTWTDQTLTWAQEHYEREWDVISRSPAHPDGPDPVEMLYDSLGGLMPHEHEWLTLAATIRDAVSAYEVYLSKAFDEVLEHHGFVRKQRFATARWNELHEFATILGVDIKPPGVATLTDLRNILTHQRGELRQERALPSRQGRGLHESSRSFESEDHIRPPR